MKLESYKDLLVWQKAVEVTVEIYKAAGGYPKTEIYGLAAQTRKSAVSIASNIAEGWSRQHIQEYLQFLNIALGSAAELETQLIIANKLGFLGAEGFRRIGALNIEVMKMLNSLMARLRINAKIPKT